MPIYRAVNKNFFKTWNDEMAYILGFLFADGAITMSKRGTHFIAFHTMDKELLYAIKECMKADHKISKRSVRSGNVYRLQIGSKEMVEDVALFGLHQAKVQRMHFPTIPKKYSAAFIRGFFDGDGNIWMGNTHKDRMHTTISISAAFTSASIGFLEGLLEQLKNLGIEGGSIYVHASGTFGRLSFGKHDSLKIYEIMYNGSAFGNLYLKRKKAIFDAFIKMRT